MRCMHGSSYRVWEGQQPEMKGIPVGPKTLRTKFMHGSSSWVWDPAPARDEGDLNVPQNLDNEVHAWQQPLSVERRTSQRRRGSQWAPESPLPQHCARCLARWPQRSQLSAPRLPSLPRTTSGMLRQVKGTLPRPQSLLHTATGGHQTPSLRVKCKIRSRSRPGVISRAPPKQRSPTLCAV